MYLCCSHCRYVLGYTQCQNDQFLCHTENTETDSFVIRNSISIRNRTENVPNIHLEDRIQQNNTKFICKSAKTFVVERELIYFYQRVYRLVVN